MSVMSSLEKVLSSVESKPKLKHDLKVILERVNKFKIDSESDKSEPYE